MDLIEVRKEEADVCDFMGRSEGIEMSREKLLLTSDTSTRKEKSKSISTPERDSLTLNFARA